MNTSVAVEDEIDAEPVRRRFTVEEFQRMGEAGILAPEERLELIDGEVVHMAPMGPRHFWSVIHLTNFFIQLGQGEFYVSPQLPVELTRHQLNPDFALLKLRTRKDAVPRPGDCVLVVEVSDSTVKFDRNKKGRLYAEANIPEYWVMDLPANRVVVLREPREGKYRQVVEYPLGTSFVSPALGGRELRVDDLLATPS